MIKLIMTNHHVQLVMLVSGGYCYAPLEQPLPATEKIIQKVSGISKKKNSPKVIVTTFIH